MKANIKPTVCKAQLNRHVLSYSFAVGAYLSLNHTRRSILASCIRASMSVIVLAFKFSCNSTPLISQFSTFFLILLPGSNPMNHSVVKDLQYQRDYTNKHVCMKTSRLYFHGVGYIQLVNDQ